VSETERKGREREKLKLFCGEVLIGT